MNFQEITITALALAIVSTSKVAAEDIIANCNTNAPEYIDCFNDATCNWNVCFNQSKERESTFRNLSIYGGYGFPGSSFIKQDYNTTFKLDINNASSDYIELLADTYLGELGLSTEIGRFSLWTQYRWRESNGEDDRDASNEIFGNPFDREFFFDKQYEVEFGLQPEISLYEALSYIWPNGVAARNDGSFLNFQLAYRNTNYTQLTPGPDEIPEETELERFRFTLGSDNFYDIGRYSAGVLSFSPSLGIEAEVSVNYDRIEVDRGFEVGSDEGFGWGWSLAPYLEVGLNDLADLRIYYEYDWSKTAKFRVDEDVPANPEADGFGLYSIKERNEFLGIRLTFNMSNLFDGR